MKKKTHSKAKLVAKVSLFIFLCIAWAISPLWLNLCIPSHLTEEEIKQFRDQYGSKHITLEEQAKNDQRYREEEIPCGAANLSVREKLEAARFQGMILDELEYLSLIVLRVEFTGIIENTDLYHYKGYTFFFIPLFDGVGGGSGYYELKTFPFLRGGE